jgi:hypothetical protein
MSHALPGRAVVESGGKDGSYGWKNCAKVSDVFIITSKLYIFIGQVKPATLLWNTEAF